MKQTENKILTLHPEGKQGVNILLRRYQLIKDFIISTLKEKGPISFKDLNALAKRSLASSFDGKVSRYLVTVKLDLEARNLIETFPKSNFQQVTLKQKDIA